MIKNGRAGYTLLELVIACALVMIVLFGLYSMFTSMVTFQVEGVRKASVDSMTMASLSEMTKEIEDANILYFPNSATPTSDAIMGCSNWSSMINGPSSGGPIDANAATTWFYYCYDKTSSTSGIYYLRRLSASGSGGSVPSCPDRGVAPGAYIADCTANGNLPGNGAKMNDVLASNVNYVTGSSNLFSYTATGPGNGVNMFFVVGNPNSGSTGGAGESAPSSSARILNPQTTMVNTTIAIDRPYMNSND